MEAIGVLSGKYNDKDPKKSNFFRVDASMANWKPEWTPNSAPMGWYEWYQGYAAGKRTKDDEHQIKRWASFKARHLAQLKKADPGLSNLSVQPKRRQAMLHWGLAPGIDVGRAVKTGGVNEYLEKASSMYSRARYHDDEKRLDNSEHTLSSLKYDGANYFMAFNEHGVPKFISRRLSVKGEQIEKADRVPHLAKTLPSQAGKVYNVELIHTGHDPHNPESHARVSGLLNSLPERSLREQSVDGPIRAVVFDLIHPAQNTFNDKIPHLHGLVQDFGDSNLLFSPRFEVGERGRKLLSEISKKEGREGVITLDPTKDEAGNVRVKLKHKNHYNLKVRAILQEKDILGNLKPSAGALELEDATGRHVGNVGTGFDRKTRQEIFSNPNAWINKIIQVEAMKPTATQLRQPVYNGDADGELDIVHHA
jgi:hypothetical protein